MLRQYRKKLKSKERLQPCNRKEQEAVFLCYKKSLMSERKLKWDYEICSMLSMETEEYGNEIRTYELSLFKISDQKIS